ncbi:hypothetical protein ElyMa_002131800 [Elysia marginata]|uniref:Uncharacterized protein n=1 Tax=Elysia marginata TaxID=1093978 RepID=A0AAV4FIU1_9GAST|nr:hypothetical protein ElyMa_002131800 [Elysia marginata]
MSQQQQYTRQNQNERQNKTSRTDLPIQPGTHRTQTPTAMSHSAETQESEEPSKRPHTSTPNVDKHVNIEQITPIQHRLQDIASNEDERSPTPVKNTGKTVKGPLDRWVQSETK